MLGITPQYRSTIRNYVIAFGSVFDDITVARKDSVGKTQQLIKVPLAYGPGQKYLSRLDAQSQSNEVAITLPRMSFEMTSFNYDPTRKRSKIRGVRNIKNPDDNTSNFVYNPVPWDIGFALSIMVKNAEDGTQILEQILPFFTPSFILPIKEVEEMNLTTDVPLILDSVDVQDEYEGDFLTRRALIWTLSFTMKGQIYGTVAKRDIIRTALTNTYDKDNPDQKFTSSVVPNDFGFGTDLP